MKKSKLLFKLLLTISAALLFGVFAGNSSSVHTSQTETAQAATISKKYKVLKSNSNSASMANKFYTHTAKITKSGNKYKVMLYVAYPKKFPTVGNIGSKAVTPISVLGSKVPSSRISYGKSSKDYTMNYYFYVSKLSKLNKSVKAQIHVRVPQAKISNVFTIRFDFK